MTKLFGDMSREEKLDLFIHYLDGGKMEVKSMSSGTWCTTENPNWNTKCAYRKAVTKPSINWDHVSPSFNYMATDFDGYTYLYDSKPELRGNIYYSGGNISKVIGFASFIPGTCDFKDSLVKRP